MAMDQRKLGNLALIAVAVAWGTMIPVISYLAQTWDPFFLGAVRYVCGVPVLFAALWLAEGFARPAVRPAVWRALLPGWLGLGGFAFIFTIGVAHANPVIAAVLGAANPVIAAVVGGVIFRIPFDRRLTPAVVLAVVGCALATIDWSGGSLSLELRGGEPLVLIASGLWAWYSIAIHRWLGGWSQLRKAANTMAHGAVPLIVGYFLARELGWAQASPAMPTGWDLGIFVWIIAGVVVIGLLLWNFGVAKTNLVIASLYTNLVPVVAIALLAIGGAAPTLAQIAGGALVIGGVAWSEWRLLRARAAAERSLTAAPDRTVD
jgi:drug/metabolite transporter (DMT)-like permease